jgi:ABC-type uncharacterized transport system substrate-binding protein
VRAATAAFLLTALSAAPSHAHPDVWISNQLTTVFDEAGRLAEVRQKWAFDFAYSTLAGQLLDKNENGAFDLDELLAAISPGGFLGWIGQTNYMTRLTLAGRSVPHAPVLGLTIGIAEGKLIVEFAIPLDGPQPVADGAGVDVFDETYCYGFEYVPVQAIGTPAGCRVDRRWGPNLTAQGTPSTELAEKFLEGNNYAVRVQIDCVR